MSDDDYSELHTPGIECEDRQWMVIPPELMNPKKMCAVNQFMHVVSELSDPYYSTSCELVLFGTGTAMPEHFRWMIYCMEMVNGISSIKGCFVPVLNKTRSLKVAVGRQTAKSKNYDVIGIERVVPNGRKHDRSRQKNWIKTLTPQETFLAECSRLTTDQIYARVNLVELHWGLIPVEYEEYGERRRKIFHVLRVIPQPGLHLLELIRRRFFERRNDIKLKEAPMINEVCQYLQQIVNHEADINYGMQGVWDHSLPSPWTVTDPVNPTSVQRILSPFTVMRRLLQHVQGGHCGITETQETGLAQSTLVIDGFPDVSTAEAAEETLSFYRDRQELYLSALRGFELDFHTNVAACAKEPDKEVDLKPILSEKGVSYNLINTRLNMVFVLQNFMKFSKERLFVEAERLSIPKLGIAMIDLFLFFDTSSSDQMAFITAHVGEQLAAEIVTETKIAVKYRVTDVQSLEDFPKAGQHKSARDGYRRNAATLVHGDRVTQEIADLYHGYLKLQFTATMNGLLMDSWISDRVYRSAIILDQLVGDLCPCAMTKKALQWSYDSLPRDSVRAAQVLLHDEVSFTWARINGALCIFNTTVKANPLNLAIIWSMVKSDILTFLGLHNRTWRWIMYCVQIAPLYGHLRTQTEDGHAARGECIMTSKPNSVGLNEVIVKTVNYCLEGLLNFIVPLTDEDRRVLRLDKVDRRTRAGMEASQGVELANGRVISKPTSSNLMQAVAVDEALRSFDESALAALINTALPRDSNAGEGGTCKSLKPERGYSEKGETRQLPGMGWYVLCFATNTNARNPVIAEIIKTLSCGAMVTYAPGAPQATGLASATMARVKRKRGQTSRGAVSMGESMMPADPQCGKMLAYLFSVTGMMSRHVGLVNKTGQSDWEISYPVQQYMEAVKQYFFDGFSGFVSANFSTSCDRQFKGFIARSVAACLMCTVSSSLETHSTPREATFYALQCMEGSALTLYWANMALLNGITHLLDAGLCVVNQLIRWKLDIPVLDQDFMCSVLDPLIDVNEESDDYKELKRFLERLRRARLQEGGSNDPCKDFTGSYVKVPGIGSNLDYGQVENYLLRFCGINHGSVYAYLKMFREASHKSLDLTVVLDLPHTMMDVRYLFQRMGVGYDDAWYSPPGSAYEKGTSYLILVPDPTDPKMSTTLGGVWVHVVQALVVSALIGHVELHADNSIAMGKGIFQLISKRVSPQQAVPSLSLLSENFTYRFGEVEGDAVSVPCTRDYFFRPRACYSAWRNGKIKDLNCMVGPHPAEDVLHIHAWVQLHYMHIGKLPQSFYYMPGGVPRPAELVPGRVYPVVDADEGCGVVCVCPLGKAFAILKMDGTRPKALPVARWQHYLQENGIQVAPLVHRKHAVVYTKELGFGVLIQQRLDSPHCDDWSDEYDSTIHVVPEYNYLNYGGNYSVHFDHESTTMHWRDVHQALVPLGTHIVTRKANLEGLVDAKLPQGSYEYVKGWLRYPDECDRDYHAKECVYVAFRVTSHPMECQDICVAPLPVDQCHLASDLRVDSIDYLSPDARS